jgi:hypothetical protein
MPAAANLRIVESPSMDKSKALDAALSQIERAFGKGSIMRLGKNDKHIANRSGSFYRHHHRVGRKNQHRRVNTAII